MTLRKFLNNLFSLYASKADETRCVTCTGEKRIAQRILMGKHELLRTLKNLKVSGKLRMELILNK